MNYRPTCPFLGLKDDPTTALSFPSEGNHCHRSRPVSPVNREYQQKYCLTPDHRACPLYQAARPVPMPPAIAEPVAARPPSRQMALLMALPLLIAGIVVAALLLNQLRVDGPLPDVIPDTGPEIENNWFLNGTDAETSTPFISPEQVVPAPEEKANCPLPGGWMTYIVNPTDSLYRLSVIYGVSVEQLQQVNCLGNSTAILPGEVIYVPYVPTNTAVPGLVTLTPAARGTIRPPVIQPGQPQPTLDSGGRQPEPKQPIPPTATLRSTVPVQATLVVPTSALQLTFTATLFPTSTLAPTRTLAPPTWTLAPPTSTLAPPTSTVQPSSTPRPTNTPKPSNTPRRPPRTPRPTNTFEPTFTFQPTNTPEATFTPQPTNTFEPVPTDPPPTELAPTQDPLPTELPLITDDPVPLSLSPFIDTIMDAFETLLSD